jgi:dihydroxy-acid dehydratase
MYTANTMASAIEALGMSLPNSSAQNATSSAKLADARQAGSAVVELIKRGIRPSDILTREAYENAITVVIALGGSTNAVLHLLAMAHASGVKLTLDDFTKIGKRVPVLADLKPSGRFLMSELIEIGGQTPLMKMLLDEKLLHGDCLTVTGKTLAENLKRVQRVSAESGNRALLCQPDQTRQSSCGAQGNLARGSRCKDFRAKKDCSSAARRSSLKMNRMR